MLKEYVTTNHWVDRRYERFTNSIITLPTIFFKDLNENDKGILEEELLTELKNKIKTNITVFEVEKDIDPSKYTSTIIAKPQFVYENKTYVPTFTAGDYSGNVFVGITHSEKALTLMTVKSDESDPYSLTKKAREHLKREEGVEVSEDKIDIRVLNNALFSINVDNKKLAIENKKNVVSLTPDALDYEVKKDYKKSTPGRPNFVNHKKYGRGEILSSEQSMGGKWDNVIIRFPQYQEFSPATRKFKTMFSQDYFKR
jgi:hypothetical protein